MGGSYKLLAVGGGGNSDLVILDFGSDITSTTPTVSSFTITGSSSPLGIDLVQTCSGWYGLVAGYSSSLHKIEFGSTISGTPVSQSVIGGMSSVLGVEVVYDRGSYYGFVSTESSNKLYRVDFGSDLSTGSPTVDALGDAGVLSNSQAYDLVDIGGSWYLFGRNYTSTTYFSVAFPQLCTSSISYSESANPASVSYSAAGTYDIYFAGRLGQSISTIVRTVTVTPQTAPSITMTIDSSRCILNTNTFSASPSTGLSYSWDFNGEGSASTSFESFQFPTTGEKRVVLTVSDGICTNQAIEVFDIYPQPPDPVFAFDDAQYCAAVDFSVNNTTNDAAFNGNLQYDWVIEADSNFVFEGASPTFNVAPVGTFNVTAQTSVPGCESNITSGSVTIQDSPDTDFSFSPTCDGEVTVFTNFTTGSTSQQWDFGNGFTSTQFAPEHFFDSTGVYAVSLTAVNDLGCAKTITDSLSVGHIPVPGFLVTQGCEGIVALEDTSTVVSADIAVWEWSFENELFSSAQNPIQEVTEPGIYTVRQKVISSVGCEAELLRQITVFDAAEVDFETASACDGEPFGFADISTTLANNPVVSRSWNVDGTLYENVDVQHTFPSPGQYEVSLTLTTQNLCLASKSETITVFDIPDLDFSTPAGCQNEYINISDSSTFGNDSIISRSWYLNGQVIGSGETLLHRFDIEGINQVTLSTITAEGCIYEHIEEINIFPAATAMFEPSTTFGIEGTAVSFENTSTLGSTFVWTLDGDSVANSEDFNTRFDESGDFNVSLIAISDFSCADTVSQDIRIRLPLVDLIINEILLQEDDEEFSNVIVSLENQSNLPVDELNFTVTVDDQLPIRDRIEDVVQIGESRVFQLGTSVPNRATYVCLQVTSGYNVDDNTPDNNEVCINIDPRVIFENPVPNPVSTETVVRTILPESGSVRLTLLDLAGKTELMETYPDLEPGLQAFTITMQDLDAGMYVLRIEYDGQVDTKRIIKH